MFIGNKSSVTLAVATLSLALIGSTAASAAPQSAPVVVTAPAADDDLTKVIRFGDLDLTQAADQRRLDWRINGAVRAVCGANEYYAAQTPANHSAYRACSDKALDSAAVQKTAAIARAKSRLAGGTQVADSAITISARSGS
jgi:UrcA family protein